MLGGSTGTVPGCGGAGLRGPLLKRGEGDVLRATLAGQLADVAERLPAKTALTDSRQEITYR